MTVEMGIKLAGGRNPWVAGWVATWRLWLLWCHDVAVAVVVLSLSLLSCSLVKHAQQYMAVALYIYTLYADAKLGDSPMWWPWPAQPSPLWVVLALVCLLLLLLLLSWLMVYLLHIRFV